VRSERRWGGKGSVEEDLCSVFSRLGRHVVVRFDLDVSRLGWRGETYMTFVEADNDAGLLDTFFRHRCGLMVWRQDGGIIKLSSMRLE